MAKTEKRGGYRKNAKRPTLYGARLERITITLTAEHLATLRRINPNVSQAVRSLLDDPLIALSIKLVIEKRKEQTHEDTAT